jgi:hypothetical protein
MGWQEVALSSCLTSSRAPLSSAAASPAAAELNGCRPSSCAAGKEARTKSRTSVTARAVGEGEGRSLRYLGGEEEAAERLDL